MTCIQDDLHRFLDHTKIVYIDNYKILGVSQQSDIEEIRKAYLKLSKIYHPDKCKDPHATELFKLISNSYKKLTNESSDSSSGSGSSNNDISLEEALDLFLKLVIVDKIHIDLYTKLFLHPKEISFAEGVTLGYSFYKMIVYK